MSGILAALAGIKTAIATAVDEYFNRTTLLLNTSSTNGAQNNTFLDSSTNNFTITRNGNTTQGTFTPFSQTGWSNYFSATGDNIRTGTMTALGSDFTLECWVNPSSFVNYNLIWDNRTSDANTSGFALGLDANGKAYFYTNNLFQITTTTALVANRWTHIALVRSGTGSGNCKIFINGVADATTGTYTTSFTNTAAYIGNDWDGTGAPFVGYISNLRATTGALYSSTFTPNTTPLTTTVSAGTCVLLTCQSNRFIDNSASAVSITPNSTPSVQAFSPFAPTAAYDTAVVGGSGYFDGTGDYLSAGTNSAFAFGTGDFTIECWIYLTGANVNYRSIVSTRSSSGSGNGWVLATDASGSIYIYSNAFLVQASSAIVPNTWYHVAVCRASGTTTLYLNGVSKSTSTTARDYTDSGLAISNDPYVSGEVWQGYITGMRLVKGTAVYTSAFTPPTAPPTAITNTSLLLSATNSGIYDSTAKNVLETVGNAQVSTTQAKWGTTSLGFDGTGDWLFLNSNAPSPIALGGGDFTVEMWLYPNSSYSGAYAGIMDSRTSGDGAGLVYFGYTGTANQIGWKDNTTNVVTGTVTQSAWNHVAVVRDSGTLKLYINGSLASSGSNSTNYTAPFKYIGSSFDPLAFNGYMDDLRITRGYARYSGSTYTQPAAAFPLQ